MTFPLRAAVIAAVLFSVIGASAQSSPPSPIIKSPNPATSATTDEDGNNPLAREGENSPTGLGPSISTNPPVRGTVGSGPGTREEENQAPSIKPPENIEK
jgi:hypothetical protein